MDLLPTWIAGSLYLGHVYLARLSCWAQRDWDADVGSRAATREAS